MRKIVLFLFIPIVSLFIIFFAACQGSGNNISSGNNAPIVDQVVLKLTDTVRLEDAKIKMTSTPSVSYSVNPSGFDYEELNKRGYIMKITLSFDAYYVKDWNVPLDIGYKGAPYYTITLRNSDYMGFEEKKLAYKDTQRETFSKNLSIADIMNTNLILSFSTQNVQNVVNIKNASIRYECYK